MKTIICENFGPLDTLVYKEVDIPEIKNPDDILIKVGNKDIETASEVLEQISKNGIKKQVNILLKRKNKFIELRVIPTDITNLQNN